MTTKIKINPKKPKKTSSNKTIEEEYKKYTHHQHILEIPDTYVGSIDKTKDSFWLLNDKKDGMEWSEIEVIPALYKIFDEILVNAYDHFIRSKMNNAKNSDVLLVKNIKVNINNETSEISVYNDGEGIPVDIHSEYKIYLPEMIFGNLLTSSNYNKNEKKITGGKNGYGAKLANIYSSRFTIETQDRIHKKKYFQVFEENMTQIKKPNVNSCYNKKGYTIISFIPDLKRFGIQKLTDDMIRLIERRTYDIAACTDNNVSVYFNDNLITYKSFEKYVDLYIGDKKETTRSFESVNDRWEIAATISPSDKFEHISFVNGISTGKGGKHVEYITNQIVNKLSEIIKKKTGVIVKKNFVKENLIVFVKSIIEDPSFDSQVKDTMTTPSSKFGSECKVSDKFIQKLSKCGIIEKAVSLTNLKDNKSMSKTDGKKRNTLRGIPKLDDANFAGSNKSREACLILTEGDSAKTMAISGLSVVGRDKYGVFPLRGKLLNVKDAPSQKISDNEEITNLKKIIGLQSGKEYDNLNDLRYGKIMIMTDQDHDGFHIKGLLFNLFHSLWPSLLKQDKFICSMITPIVKVTKGKTVLSFYNEKDYLHWKEENNNGQGWNIKYYKGLGTSNSKEAKEYFQSMNVIDYNWNDDSHESLDLAFNKERADDRKKWLSNFDEENLLDTKEKSVTYDQFIHGELIQFSKTDLERSLPSMVDGLKESQRKVLFGTFKRNLKSEVRVAQLAGYVSEHAAYHHGEASLHSTIINMAQDFVGSNNINLLVPEGQFGTRLMGGKDSSAPRYIHTYLSNITQSIFPKEDFPILEYSDDDGIQVEPLYYTPIIPMILVNGSIGIGTGFSTNIPCFNPQEIIQQIKNKLNGGQILDIKPWYRNFKGTIEKITPNKYLSKGKYRKIKNNVIEVYELPVGMWTDDYKAYLETILYDNEIVKKSKDGKEKKIKKTGPLKNYTNHSTESTVSIILEFMPDVFEEWEKDTTDYGSFTKIEKELKLTTSKYTNMSNMYLFDGSDHIKKYLTITEIIEDFYTVRLDTYEKRRVYELDKLNAHLNVISARYRFILEFINDEIVITKRKKVDVYHDLETRSYPKYNSKFVLMDMDSSDSEHIYYNYLIKMSIDSLTEEKLEELSKEIDNTKCQIDYLEKITPSELWKIELDKLSEQYDKIYSELNEDKSVSHSNNTVSKKLKLKKKK